jgi:hypothetical protein
MSAKMEFDVQRAAILRMLIYPIQFDTEPVMGVDRVLKMVVYADHTKLQVPDIIVAIDAGLGSDAKLSELIPQPHSESVIREFLSALLTRLQAEPKKN